MIQHADQLKALDFEGARALHIGDPADETRPLCGRDGEAIIVGTVTETTGRRWCRGCRSQAEAIVLVRTPDPQTGEAIEDLRAPESFRPSAPAPPFKLTKAQRSEILAGDAPRLAFPRPQPEDWPEDKPYPAAPGEIVPVSRSVNFIVTGIRQTLTEFVVLGEVHDTRRDPARFTTAKRLDPQTANFTGQEFRTEREGEGATPAEKRELNERLRQAELDRQTRTRDDLARHLKEQARAPRDVRYHLKKTIEAIEVRIGYLQKEVADAALAAAKDRERVALFDREQEERRAA